MLWVRLSIFYMVKSHLYFFAIVYRYITLSHFLLGCWQFFSLFLEALFILEILILYDKSCKYFFKTDIFKETCWNGVTVACSHVNWMDVAMWEGVFVFLQRGLWNWSRVLTRKNRLWIMYNIVGNWEMILKFKKEVEARNINLESVNIEIVFKAMELQLHSVSRGRRYLIL